MASSYEYAPARLSARGPDGREAVVLERGARVPSSVRLVFATERPGQRELALTLFELGEDDEERVLGGVCCALPPGLPANCWLQVYVEIDERLGVKVRVRENLRRLELEARFDDRADPACVYSQR